MNLESHQLKSVAIILVLLVLGTLAYWLIASRPPASISFKFPRTAVSGEELTVPLFVSTDVALNAAEFYFGFPTDLLEVKEISKQASFFELWIKDSPSFDNERGLIYIAGGLPTPGFKGRNGLVATVKFKARTSGNGEITLDHDKSRILANDGLGSQIPASFEPIGFTIR